MKHLFVLTCVALAACSGGETAATDGGGGEALSATRRTGAVAIESAEPWPADVPIFAPAYPGAVVTTVGENTGNGTTGSSITFNTPDSPTAVVAFYQAQAAKAGLARIAALSTDQSSLFSAGDPTTGRALTIQAAARKGHTAAALTIAKARQGE